MIDHRHLNDVLEALKDSGFRNAGWFRLGLTMGLYDTTLDSIKDKYTDSSECLRECLAKWLRRSDKVDSKGRPSLYTLAKALERIDEKAAAEIIINKLSINNLCTI